MSVPVPLPELDILRGVVFQNSSICIAPAQVHPVPIQKVFKMTVEVTVGFMMARSQCLPCITICR